MFLPVTRPYGVAARNAERTQTCHGGSLGRKVVNPVMLFLHHQMMRALGVTIGKKKAETLNSLESSSFSK